MEENKEITENIEPAAEGLPAKHPDYDGMKYSMRRVSICVFMLIVGIVLIAASKGDISFILVGILFIVVAVLLFRIARKGVSSFLKEQKEWEKRFSEDSTED